MVMTPPAILRADQNPLLSSRRLIMSNAADASPSGAGGGTSESNRGGRGGGGGRGRGRPNPPRGFWDWGGRVGGRRGGGSSSSSLEPQILSAENIASPTGGHINRGRGRGGGRGRGLIRGGGRGGFTPRATHCTFHTLAFNASTDNFGSHTYVSIVLSLPLVSDR